MNYLTLTTSNLSYENRPFYFFNKHVETIFPSVFYKLEDITYQRERLELEDGDFLDLDWNKDNNNRLVILSHGMGGSSDRHYVKRSASYFTERGWDVLAWNNRGCSGEINRLPYLNHHGDHLDLESVVSYALQFPYQELLLVGFSMGGSHVGNFLSRSEIASDPRIICGAGFSVTGDMKSMMAEVSKPTNWVYRSSFMKKLKEGITQLNNLHPDTISLDGLDKLTSFEEFHEKYTVPLGNFEDIADFYRQSSVNNFLPDLKKPFLMVNALNDPLLGQACYPYNLGKNIPLLQLETPRHGGHLGFNYARKKYSYMELASEAFFKENVN